MLRGHGTGVLWKNDQVSKITGGKPAKLIFPAGSIGRTAGIACQGFQDVQALCRIPPVCPWGPIRAAARDCGMETEKRIGRFYRRI